VLQAIRYGGVISDTRRLSRSHRLIGDRLLWSGGVSMGFRPMPRLLRRLSAEIGRAYPQLSNMPLEFAWAAAAGRASTTCRRSAGSRPACGSPRPSANPDWR